MLTLRNSTCTPNICGMWDEIILYNFSVFKRVQGHNSASSGPVLESKGRHLVFRKKGKKRQNIVKKGKRFENLAKNV